MSENREPPRADAAARYADLLNGIDAIVWEADAETWHFTFVNRKAEDLLGYPVAEWLSDPDFWLGRLVHPEDREYSADVCRRAAAEGREHEFEYRAIAADGRVLWLHDRVRGVPAAPGERPLLRGVMMDVTERRRMADALRENEERLARLAATSPDGIITIDESSIITFVNPAAEAMFGYSREEMIGQSLTSLMPDRFRSSHLKGVQRFNRTGERHLPQVSAELVGRKKDGAEFPIEIAFGEYLRDRRRYYTGFIRDLSERQTREAALQESQELFREITEAISEVFWLTEPRSGSILYVSPGYEAIWGQKPESLIADPDSWYHSIHPEDAARVSNALAHVAEGAYEIEYRIVRPDGEVRWIRDRVSPVFDAGGTLMRIAGVADDITPSILAEKELRESEERLRLAALATQDVIWDWNLSTGRDTWSHALSERFGYPDHVRETEGKWWEARLHPADRDRVLESLQRCIRTRARTWSEEYRFQRADGSWAYLLDRGHLVIDADGQPIRMIGAMMDQTAWHESQAALKASEERFRALIEHSAEIITILDANGVIQYESPAITRVLGYEPDELNGRNVFDLVHPDDVDQVASVFRRVAAEPGFTTVVEFRFRRKDDSWAVLSSIGNNALGNSAVAGIVVNSHDVTRERARDQHLRRAERLASIGTLVGGVAHELNNPLHAIMGFADLLIAEAADADEREALQTIQREARRAAKIVSELRLLARQSQSAALIQEALDLNDVVTHVLKTREYQFRAHNINVQTELASNLAPTIGDSGQIEQVVLNLIVNAEQALQTVTHDRQIVIRTQSSDTAVIVSITDNGPGIARENFDRLFDPFWTTKQPGEGTGLGLSLAHSIVTEHGGRIRVESRQGAGAMFFVELPRAGTSVDPGESPAPVETAGNPPLRILVVEDELAVRRLLERLLQRWGHEIGAAADGREALALLESAEADGRPYHLILSDLRMPGMSGEVLLQRLREQHPGYMNRLAFLTGDVSSHELERMVGAADIPILQKPYDPQKLRDLIESMRPGSQ